MDPDVDEKKLALESEQKITRSWLNHPLGLSVQSDLKSQQDAFVDLLCNSSVVDLATLVAHFEAIGHLRGLRYASSKIHERADEIETELKELQ